MEYQIENRFTRQVQFTANIDADEKSSIHFKIGLAVKWAIKNGVDLYGADLSGADLSGADLRSADLRSADLSGADLSGANLRHTYLRNTDLNGADLRYANLRLTSLSGADLRGANLGDFPVTIKNIHQTIYEAASKEGALDMNYWHCDTSHCRAGWVTTLAGEGGKALEWAYGTSTAAALIYIASDPSLEAIPNFYCSNREALADMERLAELESLGN